MPGPDASGRTIDLPSAGALSVNLLRQVRQLGEPSPAELASLLRGYLVRHAERLNPPPIEEYLRAFPRLLEDEELVVDLIYLEFMLAERRGAQPTRAQYLDRFPAYHHKLHRQLLLHEAMQEPDADDPAAQSKSEATSDDWRKLPPIGSEANTLVPPAPPQPAPPAQRAGVAPLTLPRGNFEATMEVVRTCAPLQGTLAEDNAASQPTIPPRTEVPVLPGYTIEGELGRGGMGVVYKARQTALRRIVALKMIVNGRAGATDLARFRAEADAMAQLKHPNIVQIFEIGAVSGQPYFSLEYIEGTSLDKRQGGNPQPPRAAAILSATIARAIHVAHQAGIIHRDLKPANILLQMPEAEAKRTEPPWTLSETQLPKITDFGLAKRLDDSSGLTQSGAIMGTPSYMAPEQAEGKVEEVGIRTDVYAVGALLYELLTGRPPFKAETPLETIVQVVHFEPVSPRTLIPKVPVDLETICLKCLSKQPEKRYATAEALAEDLDNYLADRPIVARRAGPLERAVKFARRRPALATLLAGGVAAVLAFVGLAVYYNVELQDQLALERDKVQQQETYINERKRLAALQADTDERINKARGAAERGDWPTARSTALEAQTRVSREQELTELRQQVDELVRWTTAGEAAQQQRQRFRSLHEQTVSFLSQFSGRDAGADLQDLRATARQALAQFAVDPEKDAGPTFDERYFTAADIKALTADCYELLLILATAEATTPPGQNAAPLRLGKARVILERATKLGAPTRSWYLRRAEILEALRDLDAAKQARQDAEKVEPTTAADFFLLGEQAYNRTEIQAALEWFSGALRVRYDHYPALYFLAICHARLSALGATEADRQVHAQAAVEGFTTCIGRNPGSVWNYLLRAHALGELKEYRLADQDFDTALALKPDSTALYGIYVNRGVMRTRQANFDKARLDLARAIELQPKQFQAYANLARVYMEQNQWDRALDALKDALKFEPNSAAIYRTRALIYGKADRPREALADLDKTIALHGARRNLEVAADHVQRAKIHRHLGQFEPALADCRMASAIWPLYLEAPLLMGEIRLDQQRPADAVELLRGAVKLMPSSVRAQRALALALVRTKQNAEALSHLSFALGASPDAPTYVLRGLTFTTLELTTAALQDFENALLLDATYAPAYNGRGFLRAYKGDYKLGIEDAEEALKHGSARDAQVAYNAARIYGLATAVVSRGTTPNRDLIVRYQARALQLLEETLKRLPEGERATFFQQTAANDAALNALREAVEYKRIEREHGRQR